MLSATMEINHCRREAAVAQQSADGHQVDSGLQESRRIRVP